MFLCLNVLQRAAIVCLAIAPTITAQKIHTYVGDIGPDFVLVAWGTTGGSNSIGRSSKPLGKATLRVVDGGEQTVSDRNFAIVRGLTPDKAYRYEVTVDGKKVGAGEIRTWPLKSDKLCYLVIGDYGSGDELQARVAPVMSSEVRKRAGGDCPIRFVLTTGDNIYGKFGFTLRFNQTGSEDRDWDRKFFRPYEAVLSRIPFYPSLGNHDGNETEQRADLTTYLDNFFFPGSQPARYYRFSYGGYADFFALDSTNNTESGPPTPAYSKGSEQFRWAQKNFGESEVAWKIPYFHHPPFNAGPRHPAAAADLAHFLDLFKRSGVKVVFTGHEHNYQFSRKNGQTGDVRYIVTGAGGELRTGDVRSSMGKAQIEGWAPQLHFLVVEMNGKEMRITPTSFEPVVVRDSNGRQLEQSLRVTLP